MTFARDSLKPEKMMFKSSEGCQMCSREQISSTSCSRTGDRRQIGQIRRPSARLLVGAALGSR